MAKQKPAEIKEEYRGKIYAGIAKYPGRYSQIGGNEEEAEFIERLSILEKAGGKIMQTYQVNQIGFEMIEFAVEHMNRGTKFGDLSKLLS